MRRIEPHHVPVAGRLYPDDPPGIIGDQSLQRRIGAHHAMPGADERSQRPSDQCLTADHVFALVDTPPIGPQRAAHQRLQLTNLGAGDVRWKDRAPAAHGPRGLGEIVGHAAIDEVLEPRILFQFGDHHRAATQIGLAQRHRRIVADDRIEVGARCLRPVVEPATQLGRVARQPDAGSGIGGGATDIGRFLDHQGAQPAGCRGVGTDQSAARADDDDIELLSRVGGHGPYPSCHKVCKLATGCGQQTT